MYRLVWHMSHLKHLFQLAVNFEQHPDAEIIKGLGVTKSELDLFLRANSKIRKNKSFCDRIKKLWTALYAKELFLRPGQFEELCQRFGFDRGEAIEISSTLASRCANLKNFCVALQKLWWYPPLATAVISKLNDACEDELRPFLEIQHVTRLLIPCYLSFS
ncbi:uncharacterized protein LOC127751479 [Frankliniella occidentalis]|uniref:Uncharacterized protein LOC127751479 n=1 Tax=Frankliniella occidentalis TaxID=133901 RepID=A0A9C6X8M6_FRAOC|nr:uncharacterized protein LOC127751479 [Frankliniella occidentalis]